VAAEINPIPGTDKMIFISSSKGLTFSAISALPAAEMPAQLMAYSAHVFGKTPGAAAAPLPKAENAFKKIFILLRAQTGHDFSQYKPSTIHRCIERRMAIHQIETMDGYVKYLQQTPVEVEALFRDLLIGVTSFFRDPEAFKALEDQVIPKLFAGKNSNNVIPVWSPGFGYFGFIDSDNFFKRNKASSNLYNSIKTNPVE
jgi:hypothetical protein